MYTGAKIETLLVSNWIQSYKDGMKLRFTLTNKLTQKNYVLNIVLFDDKMKMAVVDVLNYTKVIILEFHKD